MWDLGGYDSSSLYLLRVSFDLSFHIDFRTQLSATDYSNFLANEAPPISTATISEKATQVLVDQFNFLRSNAVEPLSKFLDYITYAYHFSRSCVLSVAHGIENCSGMHI